jgi:putative transposase
MKDPFGEKASSFDKLRMTKNSADAVPTFCSKVGTKVGTDDKLVGTGDKLNKINNLRQSVKWINASEGRNRLGISDRAIRKHCKQGHFVTRKVKMNGGWGYEIALESMFNYYNSIGDWSKCEKILRMIKERYDLELRPKGQEGQNRILNDLALAKFQICKLLDEVILKADKKTIAVERFVNSFNQGSYPALLECVGKISVRSVYRWYRDLSDSNWDISIFEKELKPTARTISNKEAEILIPMLLNPNRPLISETLKQAKEEFLKRGIALKSDVTYRRFIQDWTSRNIDLWTLGRYGMKAFNDKILKDILRDKNRIEVGDILVADGHTMNVMVINPLTGRPQRMTLVMFFDFKSSMPVGWEIMPTENVLTIASALRRAILMLGKCLTPNPSPKERGSLKYDELGIRWNERLREHYATPKQLRMLEAMWMTSPRVEHKTEEAFKHFVKRISGKEKLEWLMMSDVRKIKKAIESL